MELMEISKKDFNNFVATLLQGTDEIIGVVKKGKKFAFAALDDVSELCLDYDETILPPKKYFLPVKETLLTYKTKDSASYQEVLDDTTRVIIGVHPGDLAAIALLDKAYSEGEKDNHYIKRRENSTIIGLYPTKPYEYRFTNSILNNGDGYNGDAYKAADCFLVELDNDTYGLEIVTEKGKKLFEGLNTPKAKEGLVAKVLNKFKSCNCNEGLKKKIEKAKTKVEDKVSMPMKGKELADFLQGKETHKVWKNKAEKCFSCGSCVLVCPTCYCFDVKDEVELSLEKGERVRSWDGCMLSKFATVADGHNFRNLAADRLRHRVYRKTKYIFEKLEMAGCVGCGRCAQACVANIASPVEIVNELKK